MPPLPDNWAACVATVFDDAVDQLSILGMDYKTIFKGVGDDI